MQNFTLTIQMMNEHKSTARVDSIKFIYKYCHLRT